MNGTVGTKLTYDRVTGVLVDGYGSFGQFTVEIVLNSSTINMPLPAIVVVAAAVAIVAAVVGGWYASSRKPRSR
jgi:hypothetical protein